LASNNLDKYQVYELASLVILQRWRKTGESKDDAHPRSTDLLL